MFKTLILTLKKTWERKPTMGQRVLYSSLPPQGKDYYIASFLGGKAIERKSC